MWPRVIPKQPTFDIDPDLYGALGVGQEADASQIDQAYRTLLVQHPEYDQISYLAWKVLRDPIYAQLYREHRSLKYLYETGFFVDGIHPKDIHRLDFIPGLFTTPTHKVWANLRQSPPSKKRVVLLTTGGFSPIHNGHIGMMEVAKKELEANGYTVLGGYFSPSHDDYVSTKYSGEAELNADHRIYLSQLAVKESDWLMVDPWESRFVPTDINFTDVVRHLHEYLNHFIQADSPIEVFYVFGGDNAKFVRACTATGGCVCIARDDMQQLQVRTEAGVAGNSRILFTQNLASYANASSSAARKWKANLMPDEVSDAYFRWRKNLLSVEEGPSDRSPKLYIVRDEDSWAVDPWIQKFGADKVLAAKARFSEELQECLRDAFSHARLPDLPSSIDTRLYHLSEQVKYVHDLAGREQVLNLDRCTNDGGGINLSRQFYLADGQLRSSRLIGRPGFPDLETQVAAIVPGEYTLLDDDIASGSTVNMLMGSLPEDVHITKIRTLINYSRNQYHHAHPDTFDRDAFDVVDLRDFMIGSQSGGLVVALADGVIARAPYLQPYTSLISRASIPPSSEMALSGRLWQMNLEFFESLGQPAHLSDLDEYAQKLFTYLGFAPNMLLTDLCRWHLEKMYFKHQ